MIANELTELQCWMVGILRERSALSKSAEITEVARRHFTGNDRLSPIEQVNVYREQFWLRHTTSLVEDFPGLGGIVGQDIWERLVEEYLTEVPPTSNTLRDLGDRMPAHVASRDWLEHRELCADMARLEWLYVEVFDAADAGALDGAAIASVPEAAWATAKIEVAPSLRLLRTRFPVAELRERIRREETVSIPPEDPQLIALYRNPKRLLSYEVLGAAAYVFLEELARGTPLVPAAERAVERHPEEARAVEASVGGWFAEWGKKGIVTGVVVP